VQPRGRFDELAIVKALADESRDGVILFDADGKALHRNHAACTLLSESELTDEQEIESVCALAMQLGEKRTLDVNGFSMTVVPLSDDTAAQRIGLLTLWRRPHELTDAILREKFGLSPREAQIALLLCERKTDAEIACALGISWHTVRSHIEGIFTVLGCHTRRDVANLLRTKA
jgi:DNA-binding CsgD family transcriptional regulator